ncbi:unnamed protein product [Anisakis simplex]|uniref:NPH3 domain-containing protein n=1 Tax=Anisakis simplex TaxID=6269 RepID=A0A0M3KIH7_ANISI|nr:unnamed protein product [Anisakis simplex]
MKKCFSGSVKDNTSFKQFSTDNGREKVELPFCESIPILEIDSERVDICTVQLLLYRYDDRVDAAKTSLLVRILIDAVLGLCTDKQLRKGMSTTETSGSSSTRQNGRSRTPCSGIRRITNRCGSYPIQAASDVISTQKANSIEATNC